MQTSHSLIICAFDGQVEAEAAKNAIDELGNEIDELQIIRTAIVRKNDRGEVTFHEPGNAREVAVDVAGALAKGVSWLIYNAAGMLGPLAGVSAEEQAKLTVERFTRDTGFPDEALLELGARLDAGHSALIALVDAGDRDAVVKLLTDMGGHVIDSAVPPDLLTRLLR